jgi:hypothetical protein
MTLLAHELAHVVQQSAGASVTLRRQPAPCGLVAKDLQARMNELLPWGYQVGDSDAEVRNKLDAMKRNPDYLEILNRCLPLSLTSPQSIFIVGASQRAVGVSLQEILDGVLAGSPFQLVRIPAAGQQLEAWLDPRALPGSQRIVEDPRYIVGGPQAGAVNLPGAAGATPQCGDTCSDAERRVTEEAFDDPEQAVRSCCDTAQCDDIRTALSTAREHIDRTLVRMRARLTMDREMDRHFNRSDEAAYLDVQEALERVLPDLEFSRHQWFCRVRGKADQACSGRIGGRAKLWRILLCFERGRIEWDSVLHEVMHTSGLATGVREVYRHESRSYPPSDALRNADSYAGFVADAGDPGWQEGKQFAFDIRAEAGSPLVGRAPVLGARFEWTPRGPGLRLLDLTLGTSMLWSSKAGALPGEAGLRVGGEIGLRIRPRSVPLIFDLDAGALVGLGGSGRASVTGRLSATWQIGGLDSRILAGVDLRAIYDEAKAQPDQWILGVSIGRRWGRPSRRRRLSRRAD